MLPLLSCQLSFRSVFPSFSDLIVSDKELTMLYRVLFCLPVASYDLLPASSSESISPQQCFICSNQLLNGFHPFDCAGTYQSRLRTDRHNSINTLLFQMVRSVGCISMAEPRSSETYRMEHKNGCRGDLNVILDDGLPPVVIDVQVIDPCAPSHLKKSSRDVALVTAERGKRRKYSNNNPDMPSSALIPFVISIFGHLGPDAASLLERIKVIARERHVPFAPSWWCARMGGRLLHALSAQLVSFNRTFSNKIAKNQTLLSQQSYRDADLSEQHIIFIEQNCSSIRDS